MGRLFDKQEAMIQQAQMVEATAPAVSCMSWHDVLLALGRIEWTVKLFAFGVTALYFPTIRDTAENWFIDENHAHGVFIVPIALVLLWLDRNAIARAEKRPAACGLVLLALGLFVETASYLLQLRYLGFWSLILALAGAVLALHGAALWRLVRFPVCFLLFAGAMPGTIIGKVSGWLQSASTVSAATVMGALGFPLTRAGNLIQIPGGQLEVADVCSGFKKTIALLAFAFLYGYLFRLSPAKRLLLAALSVPIALLANIVRVGGLVAAASWGGERWLHAAHDGAEMAVLVVAFFLFVGVGKVLGCKKLRYSA